MFKFVWLVLNPQPIAHLLITKHSPVVIMGCLLWIFSVMAAMISHFAQVPGPSQQLRHQRPGGYKGF